MTFEISCQDGLNDQEAEAFVFSSLQARHKVVDGVRDEERPGGRGVVILQY